MCEGVRCVRPVREKIWDLNTAGGSDKSTSSFSYFFFPHFTFTGTEQGHAAHKHHI